VLLIGIYFEYKLIVKFSNWRILHHLVAYFYAAFVRFMKEKKLYYLIIGLFILFFPVVSTVMQELDRAVVKVDQISTISQDNSVSHDLEVSVLLSGNSEVQIRIFKEEITVLSENVSCNKFIRSYFSHRNIQNQKSVLLTRKFVTNYQCALIFTGVLLI